MLLLKNMHIIKIAFASDSIKFHEPSEYKEGGGGGGAGNPNPTPSPNPKVVKPKVPHNAHRFGGGGKGGKLDIQHEKE